jgi:hypothetical protein
MELLKSWKSDSRKLALVLFSEGAGFTAHGKIVGLTPGAVRIAGSDASADIPLAGAVVNPPSVALAGLATIVASTVIATSPKTTLLQFALPSNQVILIFDED